MVQRHVLAGKLFTGRRPKLKGSAIRMREAAGSLLYMCRCGQHHLTAPAVPLMAAKLH